MASLVFWYDYASNYAYLSAVRIKKLCSEADIELHWRPFLLGPIFQKQGWATSPFNIYQDKGKYMRRDMARLADQRGLSPFTLPPNFPQNSLLAARVGTIGAESEWIGPYTSAVFERQFAAASGIELPEIHEEILNQLRQPGSEIVSRAMSDTGIKTKLRDTTASAMEVGIFGAPSFTTEDGELFWGDDRLEDAITWAVDHG